MIGKRRWYAFILIVALSGLAGIAVAQTAVSDLVFVTAGVTGPKKVPVLGLKPESFHLFEDGVEQKITVFSATDGAWDIDLLLANSSLLPGRADRTSAAIRDAVDTFRKSGNPGNKVRVEELTLGANGLYAAIDRHLEDLQKTTNPRKALVVITDGFDAQFGASGATNVTNAGGNVSTDAAKQLVDYSKRLNIPIYFLYTYAATSDSSATAARGARASLTTLDLSEKDVLLSVAEQTGGDLYSVDALTQLESQCKLLAEEFRGMYVLGFKSTNDKKEDKWRKLKVTVKSPTEEKLSVAVKAKYFVPKPTR